MISYSSGNRDVAEELIALLRSAGVRVWVDSEGIKPGAQWRDELMRQLKTCDACIPLISSNYLQSEHCRMELFLARSFERRILPVMIDDCWNELDADESTRGLRDVFMVRLFDLRMVGLQIDRQEALARVVAAVAERTPPPKRPTFVSHLNDDAELATAVARELRDLQVPAWVATLHTVVGDDWRRAQARALGGCSSHLVILNKGITQNSILRTELLISEAIGLPLYAVYHSDIGDDRESIAAINHELRHSELTYMRLFNVNSVSLNKTTPLVPSQLAKSLWAHHRRK